MIAQKQIGSWSALELLKKQGGCELRVKHWSQHVWTLVAISILAPSICAVIGFSHSTPAGVGLLSVSILGVLIAVAGGISALDGTSVIACDCSSGLPLISIGRQIFAQEVELHEIYVDGRTFQSSYLVIRGIEKTLFLRVDETKPDKSMMEIFCEKCHIPYRSHYVHKTEELKQVYENI